MPVYHTCRWAPRGWRSTRVRLYASTAELEALPPQVWPGKREVEPSLLRLDIYLLHSIICSLFFLSLFLASASTLFVRWCLWSCSGLTVSFLSLFVCGCVVVVLFVPSRVLTSVQAIPSHGFHQFKSNNLDALQRRIDEMQVCPSVCLVSRINPSSTSHFAHLACRLLSACFNR